ncbi:aromatic acid exporter family protein [Paenibacillus athensensis]|uniref:Putative aromatic acid exporter C-terminal domain-containing protein n=1 Tax=Paenibacillus athensensis TaxID=1967502 RepID=A0A4Y8Q9A6_9BACL|nr:aromatic acid exporter family protein [Paenibacillus athensensis]MCD1257341.1 aromatic acid exporter family protein [Paenibacillus athensensis]
MGFRVLKTALAVVISIYLAIWLGLHSPASAGLLAILGIEVTKKKGVRSALFRIAASLIGLAFGWLLFGVFGYHVWVIGLFIALVYPLLYRLGISEGAVTGSVVMFHLFVGQTVGLTAIGNEVALLLVGLGTATLINIAYMPKPDRKLVALKEQVEHHFSEIFFRIADHLRDNSSIWDGRELLEAGSAIERGAELAKRSMDNTLFFGGDPYWRVYFYMRGEQLESIHRMAALIAQVYETLPQGESVAEVLEDLSEDVRQEYYSGRAEQRLRELELRYREMALPATRAEFEVRSALLQLTRELQMYLSVAKKQKKQRPEAG